MTIKLFSSPDVLFGSSNMTFNGVIAENNNVRQRISLLKYYYLRRVKMAGTPIHKNGTVGTTSTKVEFGQTINWLEIQNTHASNDLNLSFDNSNFYTIDADASLSIPVSIPYLWVKGSGAGTTYQILGIN